MKSLKLVCLACLITSVGGCGVGDVTQLDVDGHEVEIEQDADLATTGQALSISITVRGNPYINASTCRTIALGPCRNLLGRNAYISSVSIPYPYTRCTAICRR